LVEAYNELCGVMSNEKYDIFANEMIVKCCGRYLPIHQYMKAKPCWYGVKIWCLANAKSKFVQHMLVYCEAHDEDKEHAIGYKIVVILMDEHRNKNHIVTCDIYFL